MSEDWLKLHTEIIDDPKMRELTDFEFRIFISLLCIARQLKGDGQIKMTSKDMSWRLRYSVPEIESALDKLLKLNILERVTDGVTVVNYCKRQYSESFLRVKRHRERKRSVTETVKCNGTRNALVTRDKNRIDKNRIDSPPQKPTTDTRIKNLIEYFHNTYVDIFKQKPVIQGGKDGNLLKARLKLEDEEKIKSMMKEFLIGDDKFLCALPKTISTFCSSGVFEKLRHIKSVETLTPEQRATIQRMREQTDVA